MTQTDIYFFYRGACFIIFDQRSMEHDGEKKNSVLTEVMHVKIGKMLECCKVKEQNLDILPKVFL